MVLIRVKIDKQQLVTPSRGQGRRCTAQIHCGRTSLGYSLFHDLIAWFQSRSCFVSSRINSNRPTIINTVATLIAKGREATDEIQILRTLLACAWSARLPGPRSPIASETRLPRRSNGDARAAQANPFEQESAPAPAPLTSQPRLTRCLVSLIDEAQGPCAGSRRARRAGSHRRPQVQGWRALGKIDDSQPLMQGKAQWPSCNAAEEKAKSDVDERYATQGLGGCKRGMGKTLEANQKHAGSVSQVEVARLKLTWERGISEIERAQTERKMSGQPPTPRAVEVEAAKEAMKRRRLARRSTA